MSLVQTTRTSLRLAALALLAVCLAPGAASAQNEWWRGLRYRTVWVYLGRVDQKTFELITPPVHRFSNDPNRAHPAIPEKGDLVEFTADVPLRIPNYKRRGEREAFDPWWGHTPSDDDFVTIAPRGTAGVVNEVISPGSQGDDWYPVWVRITPWAPLTDIRGVTDLIMLGDPAAMQLAGESANRGFVPALKAVAGRRRYNVYDDDHASLWSHWALAKLGDRDTLQIIWCAMLSEYRSPPVWQARAIGGWFGYQALLAVLDGVADEAQRKGIAKEPLTDVGVMWVREDALNYMIELTTGQKDFRLYSDAAPVMMAWRDWAVTSTHLRTLEPTGEGVDFSKSACKHGRPRKRR